jgi:hypothetical protein
MCWLKNSDSGRGVNVKANSGAVLRGVTKATTLTQETSTRTATKMTSSTTEVERVTDTIQFLYEATATAATTQSTTSSIDSTTTVTTTPKSVTATSTIAPNMATVATATAVTSIKATIKARTTIDPTHTVEEGFGAVSKSCEQRKGNRVIKKWNHTDGVCANTTEKCKNWNNVNYADAVAFCSKDNSQLCTPKEILDGLGIKTSCETNQSKIWTTGYCGRNQRLVAQGGTQMETWCQEESLKMFSVRCCAGSAESTRTRRLTSESKNSVNPDYSVRIAMTCSVGLIVLFSFAVAAFANRRHQNTPAPAPKTPMREPDEPAYEINRGRVRQQTHNMAL